MLQEALASVARKPLVFSIGAVLGIAAALAALLLLDSALWLAFRSPFLRLTANNFAAPVFGTTALLGFCVGGVGYTRFHDLHGFGLRFALQKLTSSLKLPVQRALFLIGTCALIGSVTLSLASHRGSMLDFLEYVVVSPSFRTGHTNFFSTVVLWVGASISTSAIVLAYTYLHTISPAVRWIRGETT
jgi:hypothetical protein